MSYPWSTPSPPNWNCLATHSCYFFLHILLNVSNIYICISYCCITKYHKFSALKFIITFIISTLCWSEIWTWISWVFCFRVSGEFGVKVSARARVSSDSSTREGYASKCMWLLARVSSLQPIGPRAWVSCWLLARGHTEFLATWVSLTWLLATSKCTRQESNRVL